MAGTLFENNLSPYLTVVEQGSTPASPAVGDQRLFIRTSDHLLCYVNSSGTVTPVAAAASGSITASGYTQSTARLLGRTTASTGAIEEITVGSGLSLSAGSLTATGGGITQTYYGYNSIGASYESVTTRYAYTKTFTLAAAAICNGIDVYIKWTADNIAQFYGGIWEDNAGVPRNLIATAYSGVANINGAGGAERARWFSIPLGIYLPAGTYWMGFSFDQASSPPMSVAYDTSGSDRKFSCNGDGLIDGDMQSQTDTTRKYSMRLSTIA